MATGAVEPYVTLRKWYDNDNEVILKRISTSL